MIDQFAFLISEGFKSFYRNKLASFLCVITIFINFSILGSLFVVGYNTSSLVDFFRSKYTFEIFLVNEVKQDDYLNFIDQLSKNKIIANTELIDKEKSAAIFKEEFGEDVVEMLGYNPLPLSIKVFISEESFEFDKVDQLIETINTYNFVDEIEYRGRIGQQYNENQKIRLKLERKLSNKTIKLIEIESVNKEIQYNDYIVDIYFNYINVNEKTGTFDAKIQATYSDMALDEDYQITKSYKKYQRNCNWIWFIWFYSFSRCC